MPKTKQLVVTLGVLILLALFGLTQISTETPLGNSAAVILFGDSAVSVTIAEEPASTKQMTRERLIAQLRAGAGDSIEVPQGAFPEATITEEVTNETGVFETDVMDQCVTGGNQDSGCVSTAQTGAIESVWLGFAHDGKLIFSNSEGGQSVTTADVDSCGGHEHPILWEGQVVTLYHYHALDGSLTSVGCLPTPTEVVTPSPIMVVATTTAE